jgi:hypothetical protein
VAGTVAAVAGTVAAVAGTAEAAVGVAGIAADTTAVAGIIRQAGTDGTVVGAGGAAVTTRGGYCRYLFHGLTRITVITVLVMDRLTGTGTDTDTDTESRALLAGLTASSGLIRVRNSPG